MNRSQVNGNIYAGSHSLLELKGKQWDIANRWWGTGKNGKKIELDGIALPTDKTHILYSEAKWPQKTDLISSIKQYFFH